MSDEIQSWEIEGDLGGRDDVILMADGTLRVATADHGVVSMPASVLFSAVSLLIEHSEGCTDEMHSRGEYLVGCMRCDLALRAELLAVQRK